MEFLKDIEDKINELRIKEYKSELFASGNFIELRKGIYYLANGKNIIRETVGKKVGTGNAVAMFAVDNDGRVLLVLQPRVCLDTEDKINIEIPAGYIESDEDEIKAGLRELEEETGYVSDKVIKVDEYYPSLGASGEKITILLMLDCKKVKELDLDEDEFLLNAKVSLEEFRYLLDNNYIKDANARIGYYKYLEYIGK